MAYHAFVVMPFGVKEGIDFNRVYSEYVKPALESAGFQVFRADEEMRAGNIRTDMFQELVLADLVVADLSTDNPNVWYELGVRHALRARGVIQIKCRRDQMPFDVYTDRTLRYHVAQGSGAAAPDRVFLESDKQALAKFAVETMSSWHDRKVSPVYHLLRYLQEPDWKSLRVEEAKEFWEQYEAWADRIEIARKGNRPGDILVLAEEAPTRMFRIEAFQTAGKALLSLGQFKFALAQYENALAIDPRNPKSRRQKAALLELLKRRDEAKAWTEDLIEEFPDDAESWALLGWIEKRAWVDSWSIEGRTLKEARREAKADVAMLGEAMHAYATGFRKDPAHYESGINAVGLAYVAAHLAGAEEIPAETAEMEGGVRWAIRGALEQDARDYSARICLAELEVLAGGKQAIETAYKNAVAVADKDWFSLNAARDRLLLLRALGFRPPEVETGAAILERALSRLQPPDRAWAPHQVFLFSGHMIDAPDRPEPRFPPDKEKTAARAIAAALDKLEAGVTDLALCGGACGGDLLFAEACLERGLRLELRIPFDEPTFLRKSVAFAPGHWTERFYRVKEHANTRILVMPDELGPLPKNANPYARANLWQLYNALAWGPDRVRFICLWNRRQDGEFSGTEHMHRLVGNHSGRVHIIDTTQLW